MRNMLVLGLLLVLMAVPAAQAQQTSAPARDAQPAPPVVEAPSSVQQADSARVTAGVVQPKDEVVEVAAPREMSARTMLAIVGGAVVVLALVVLMR